MTELYKPEGVLSFMVTPTTKESAIDLQRLCTLADQQIAAGVRGLVLFGSTGAIGSFDERERRAAAEALVKHVANRVPVIVGTGSMTTDEAVRLSQHAESVGADAVIVVPITYWVLTDDELFFHFQSVAEAIRLPVILYNNPRLTGVDLLPPLVVRLTAIESVKSIKESSPDLHRIGALTRMRDGQINVIAGRDSSAFQALTEGAKGWGAGLANLAPEHCVKIYDLVQRGDLKTARRVWDELFPLAEFVMAKGLVRCCHTGLELLGQGVGQPRLPIAALHPDDADRLKDLLKGLGLLKAKRTRLAAE